MHRFEENLQKKGEKCPKGHLIFDTSSKRPGTNTNMKLHIFVFDFTARKIDFIFHRFDKQTCQNNETSLRLLHYMFFLINKY